MKRQVIRAVFGTILLCVGFAPSLRAADLWQVYQDALQNDQTLQAAYYMLKQSAEQTPQAWAQLLPVIAGTVDGGYNRQQQRGSLFGNRAFNANTDVNSGYYSFGATLTQPIFNLSAFAGLKAAHYNVKAAYATYTAAQQTLIYNTVVAYLNVLQAQEQLRYAEAQKAASLENYKQVSASFKVGVVTKTDVYQAKANYDSTIANYVTAQNNVDNAFEALRVITDKRYAELKPLNPKFVFNKPQPDHMTAWVDSTKRHNWNIKAADYTLLGQKATVRAVWAQYLPNLNAVASYNNRFAKKLANVAPSQRTENTQAYLELNVPIFNGGAISSQVRQNAALYEQYAADLQLTERQQVQQARNAFLAVSAGVSRIKADYNTIISDRLALEGVIDGYRVGTHTMLDVLNSQNTLYQALNTYAIDRYGYLQQVMALKQAAGTLGDQDVRRLNSWLAVRTNGSPEDNLADVSSFYTQPFDRRSHDIARQLAVPLADDGEHDKQTAAPHKSMTHDTSTPDDSGGTGGDSQSDAKATTQSGDDKNVGTTN